MISPELYTMSTGRYRKVPPEGGWGFLVLLGLAIFLHTNDWYDSPNKLVHWVHCTISECSKSTVKLTFTLGTFPSLALIFGEFLFEIGERPGALPMLMSWYFASFSCVGLVTNYFFKIFSVRAVALSGAMVFMSGSIWSIFANSMTELIFAFGVLEGAGFGLMISASYSTFNAYFVKKRIMMMSVAQSLFGLGTMAYPIFVQYFMDEYGYRGFMALRASMHGHVIFGMLVMHPVEWHMKKILAEDEPLVDAQVITTLNHRNDNTNQEMVSMSDEEPKTEQVTTRATQSNCITSVWKKIVDFLDLTLLKDPIYVNIVLGMSFALYSDMSFFAIQPTYLLKLGFDKPTVAQIIAIGATADLASRIFLAISSSWIRLKARDIYFIGAALTILTRFAFLYVDEFLGVVIVTATMGFLRTWIHVPLPLVFGDYLSTERFPSGYGLFMFIQGMIMFIFTALVTKIDEIVKDDAITFHCLELAMAICVVPWAIEWIWMKSKMKVDGN